MEEKHNSPATATETALPSSAEPPSSRRRGGGLKRKASNISNSITSTPPPSSSKRQTREKPSPVLFPPIHNGPCTRARLQPNYTDSTAFWDAVIVNGEGEGSMLSTPVSAKAEEELIARKEAWEALELKIEAEYEDLKSRDANAHVAPISSGWFSWTKLHPLEERALPSFFNGKLENRTPEIYMEIRNSIMKKFHTNPTTQLEEKDLSEISVGELDAKKEVMEFLDYWGLINYHPFPEPDLPTSIVDAEEPEEPEEAEKTEKAEKVNSLIQKLYEFEVEQLCSPAVTRSSFATPAVASRLPESIIADESLQPEGPSVEYHCNSCAADCSRKRYHCQKQADYDLCTECFNAGKFDSAMSPSDFILMEPADAAVTSSGKWTDQETLLLLEALELYRENWNEIAEHVATKTKAQCILHFVQMPIEDTFRDCDDDEDDGTQKEKDLKKDESLDENDEKTEADVDVDVKEKGDVDGIGESVDVKEKESEDLKAVVDNDDSSLMEVLESVDIGNLKDNEENGVDIAVKALREAFEVVGSVSSVDEKLSFADAGNPVMAMAAFLTRLVDPNIATATARNSLKSVSSGATGLQLSARHSFVIEDPIDEKKKPEETERDEVQEEVEQEDLKEKTDSDKEGINGTEKDKEKEKEKESVVVDEKKEEDGVVSKKGKNTRRKKGKDTEKLVAVVEESNEEKGEVENSSNSKKVSEEDSGESVPKDEEMSEKTEPPHEPNDTSMAENTENSVGEAEAKECKNVDKQQPDTKNDQNILNMTRAAVTAISAAAVKAKFLADQEEDQIRKLATSLIEKQLHKLETKLAFFTEMDGVVARARDQLERSKQRLYHERAQIIAARLGMSSATAAARPVPQPPRAGMSFPNPTQRPPNPNPNPNPMTMATPQRPPLTRPVMMAPTPPPPPPAAVAGNPSSVGMK